mmetsp:Transcript_17599/g.48766  ORF Transcript_17599/g.48766 Transcript_17599/m.48766 type:complete len:221 (+) Transcript_17599:14288-14950(+)
METSTLVDTVTRMVFELQGYGLNWSMPRFGNERFATAIGILHPTKLPEQPPEVSPTRGAAEGKRVVDRVTAVRPLLGYDLCVSCNENVKGLPARRTSTPGAAAREITPVLVVRLNETRLRSLPPLNDWWKWVDPIRPPIVMPAAQAPVRYTGALRAIVTVMVVAMHGIELLCPMLPISKVTARMLRGRLSSRFKAAKDAAHDSDAVFLHTELLSAHSSVR